MLDCRNRSAVIFPACLALALGTSTCSPPAPAHQEEWGGDLKPVVSVKELMRDMIDPASDFVFDAVGTIVTKNKRVERRPRTNADWDRVRIGAVTLAEGVYLLK